MPGYVYLSNNFEQQTQQGEWQAISGEVFLEQGTDNVFTTGDYKNYFGEGLPWNVTTAMQHRRGRLSQLLDTSYRCEGFVFTKKELIAISTRLRSELMGILYAVDYLPGVFAFHEAGDTYMQWAEVFIKEIKALATLTLEESKIKKTLYRTNHINSWTSLNFANFCIGYQAPQSPEFLVPVTPIELVKEWPTEELLQVLNRGEIDEAGLVKITPPKKQSFLSRLLAPVN